ncbi:MAG: UDP-N-acetylmuramate dehydrogenase [Bacteroidales bacterium]|nr:UDP-N-acetylmuramate dehydrogenase [Bacteroidales bacterium]
MIEIFQNEPLNQRNSMKVEAIAKVFIRFDAEEDYRQLINHLNEKSKPWILLGGGNNILFKPFFDGVVLYPRLFGIHRKEVISGTEDLIEVAASEDWDQFVAWSLENGYMGLENLSLIPGTVGAAPVQNIGAYGAEVEQFIEWVEGWNFETEQMQHFSRSECEFAYRDSIFKKKLKNSLLITKVGFRLSRRGELNANYGDVKARLSAIESPGAADLRQVIIDIRQSKLPDPALIPNAGSFFKNPVIPMEAMEALRKIYPEMPVYPVDSERCKLAAGWLIEKAGWKGRSLGKAAVHHQQALVIINQNGASGEEILELAAAIQADILQIFGIRLEMEVNIV